jgi:hypothetical protein
MDVYLFWRRKMKVMYHKSATNGTMLAKSTESILGPGQAVKWDPPTGREVQQHVVRTGRIDDWSVAGLPAD